MVDTQPAATTATPEVPEPAVPEATRSGDTATLPPVMVPRPDSPPVPPPTPPARTEPPVTEPATEPAAQDEGARILRRASDAYEGIRALQADFTLVANNPLLRSTTTSRGTLFQKGSDKLLLRFSEPAGDILVSDGTYFWRYYPSDDPGQVIRMAASSNAGGAVDLRAQFVGDPVSRFSYTVEGKEQVSGRATDVLTLVPRADAGYRSMKVWVDARDGLVRLFEIEESNGVRRRFELSDLRTNPTLSDELFRFTPPSGVRVIERE
jgi:outer membrane lipoprotein-sorting protein